MTIPIRIIPILVLLFFASEKGHSQSFFDKVDRFYATYVDEGSVFYSKLSQQYPEELRALVEDIRDYHLSDKDQPTRQAFLINAYNILVIHAAAIRYPMASVLDVPGFFDQKKYVVAGEYLTLNELERDRLFSSYPDPRLHFVLVCGARGCPPIVAEAYRPERIQEQLDRQTSYAMDDPDFLRVVQGKDRVELSEIFRWYKTDFGDSDEAMVAFINRYRQTDLPPHAQIDYYAYDWSLNEAAGASIQKIKVPKIAPSAEDKNEKDDQKEVINNSKRYVVSAVRPKHTTETKLFNNIYTQRTPADGGVIGDLSRRTTFSTQWLSFLYGLSNTFNVGFDLRYRRVLNTELPSSFLDVFGGLEESSGRSGFTTFGPKIRWAPVPDWKEFSVQSQFWFALEDDLEGGAQGEPYIDWNQPTWWTQLFYDRSLGTHFSLFSEVDFMWEAIGGFDRYSVPLVLIGSYFPIPEATLYGLAGYTPQWVAGSSDYFYQLGLGAKYQLSPDFEIEVLYTFFDSQSLSDLGGDAATYNLGLRYSK